MRKIGLARIVGQGILFIPRASGNIYIVRAGLAGEGKHTNIADKVPPSKIPNY